MNTPICLEHAHPLDLICADTSCTVLLCDRCFLDHHTLSGHSTVLILNQPSIGFFLDFSNFLVQTFEHYLQVVANEGFKKVFNLRTENGTYAFTKQSDNQMSQQCITTITNYRNLINSNRNFVLSNRDNMAALRHPDFLKDFGSFLLQKWDKIGYSLAEQLKEALVRTYPYRFSYKNIRFELNAGILTHIESNRLAVLEGVRPQTFTSIKSLQSLDVSLRAQLSNEARVLHQIRTVPQNLQLIDSFEQILDCEYFSCNTSRNQKHILEESIETLSPNFLSMEEMEKQIEMLLIKNEALKQENYHLRFQNDQLKQENVQLKSGINN